MGLKKAFIYGFSENGAQTEEKPVGEACQTEESMVNSVIQGDQDDSTGLTEHVWSMCN